MSISTRPWGGYIYRSADLIDQCPVAGKALWLGSSDKRVFEENYILRYVFII
jgi:hypothetical protein